MAGKLRWNLYFAFGGMLLTFLFAWNNNPFHTAFIRSMYVFVILFMVMFAVRLFIGTIIGLGSRDDTVGSNVDLSTPEDDTLAELLVQNPESDSELKSESNHHENAAKSSEQDDQFQPMKPPKLISQTSASPEHLANAVRHISEREGR